MKLIGKKCWKTHLCVIPTCENQPNKWTPAHSTVCDHENAAPTPPPAENWAL